jgi:hypothetical protein
MEPTIKLELTIPETNAVLTALAQRPYGEVAGLFTKIQQQAGPQVPPPSEEPEKVTAEVVE